MYDPLGTAIIGRARVAEYYDLTARLHMLRTVESGQRLCKSRSVYAAMLQRFVAVVLGKPRRALHANVSRGPLGAGDPRTAGEGRS